MRVTKENEAWVSTGKVQTKFKYKVYASVTAEISQWLNANYKGGYGRGYYYANGKLWFKTATDEMLYLLRWA